MNVVTKPEPIMLLILPIILSIIFTHYFFIYFHASYHLLFFKFNCVTYKIAYIAADKCQHFSVIKIDNNLNSSLKAHRYA